MMFPISSALSDLHIPPGIRQILNDSLISDRKPVLRRILSCTDLTSLSGTDTQDSIYQLCRKALSFQEKELPLPAAVCIYPNFIRVAKQVLAGSSIHVATVIGGFPHGQIPVTLKLEEARYAIGQGADELDMVFSRGAFLAGEYGQVYDEIRAIAELCNPHPLKVILETGELGSLKQIARASELAIRAGAGFIKTSTGKIPAGATLEDVYAMLLVILKTYEQTGNRIGIKPSGGISTILQAIQYDHLVQFTLGESWLTPDHVRFGVSRLADQLQDALG